MSFKTMMMAASMLVVAAGAQAAGSVSDASVTRTVVGASADNLTCTTPAANETTCTAAIPEGYTLSQFVVDGKSAVSPVTLSTAAKHTVKAVYAAKTFTVTTGTDGGGSFSPRTAKVKHGTAASFTVIPKKGYRVIGVSGAVVEPALLAAAAGGGRLTVTLASVTDTAVLGATFEKMESAKAAIYPKTDQLRALAWFDDPANVIKLDGSRSATKAGTPTYEWSITGPPGAVLAPTDAAVTTFDTATAGTWTVTLKVTDTSASGKTTSATDTAVITVTPRPPQIPLPSCVSCHDGFRDAQNNDIVTSFRSSEHGTAAMSCADCHGGHASGAGARNPKTSCSTAACHGAAGTKPALDPVAADCTRCHQQHTLAMTAPAADQKNCAACHSAAGSNHAAIKTSCTGCHDVAIKHPGTTGDANDGVRSITNEFERWSHHVTGVKLQDAHCAACHLEGEVLDGAVVPSAFHRDPASVINLRNVDTDEVFVWNPAAPDHSVMDSFCMSCHDENGATSQKSAEIRALMIPAAGKDNTTATNPFADTISNRYDKMQRPAVVNVKDQFKITNASHHAVMGQRYTKRTRVVNADDPRAMTAAEVAAFTNNSGAVSAGLVSENGKTTGKRSTIYDAGRFESTYRTLSPVPGTSDRSLGDDSVLHCGDCHTVGQFRQADVVAGSFNRAVIGAHGSANEYMLRNSIGTNERHVGWTYSGAGITTNAGAPYLICFACHKNSIYNAYGSTGTANGNHAGEYAQSSRCNGSVNTITFVGYTTSINDEHEPYAFRLGLGQRDGIVTGSTSTADTDFSNLFGIQCANCHNSGPENAFGGIHGSRIDHYTDANNAQQRPYRFLPGLGNTKFVPGSAAGVGTVSNLNWEQYNLSTKYNADKTAVIDNGGCYTLVPEKDDPPQAGQTVPANASYSLSPTFEQEIAQPAPGTKLFGTWGGCDDHRGNAHGKAFAVGTIMGKRSNGANTGWVDGWTNEGTVATGGGAVYRKVLRPVTY